MRPAARPAEALMKRFGLSVEDAIGVRFAVNVALATTIVWYTLTALGDTKVIWAIAAMVAASDPDPAEARRMFRSRLANVAVGSVTGFVFLLVAGTRTWVLPIAMATTVLLSSYVVHIKTAWRQAPITAAIVISAAMKDGTMQGVGLYRVAEVVFGSLVGIAVSMVMSKVWLIQEHS
jgi:uncharacterized membrane protein YccC